MPALSKEDFAKLSQGEQEKLAGISAPSDKAPAKSGVLSKEEFAALPEEHQTALASGKNLATFGRTDAVSGQPATKDSAITYKPRESWLMDFVTGAQGKNAVEPTTAAEIVAPMAMAAGGASMKAPSALEAAKGVAEHIPGIADVIKYGAGGYALHAIGKRLEKLAE